MGWQQAQLAAKQGFGRRRTKRGEAGKWQGYPKSRDLGVGGISPPGLATGGQAVPNPLAAALALPVPTLAATAIGRTFCKLHFYDSHLICEGKLGFLCLTPPASPHRHLPA